MDSTKNKYKLSPLHCGISVPSIDSSIQWYTSILGFKVVSDKYFPDLNSRIVFMSLDGFSIELFEVDNASKLPEERKFPNLDIKTHGTKHLAFSVEDINALIKEMKHKAVDIAIDTFIMEGQKVAFVRDNSGNLLEFIQKNI